MTGAWAARAGARGRRATATRRLGVLVLMFAVGLSAAGSALSRPPLPRLTAAIEPALGALLTAVDPAIEIPVILTLRARLNPAGVAGARRRGAAGGIAAALRDVAARSQPAVLGLIARAVAAGEASAVRPLWITNAIAVRARPATIRALAGSPAIAAIEPDRTVAAPEAPTAGAGGPAAEPNIAAIGAPTLWADGIDGSGTVVASMDTGVDASHPDLASRYRGGANSWYDPYGQHPAGPVDLNGHGTETLGVAVGGTAGGTAIGVAPGARWIAVKAFADNGLATTSGLHLAFQWLLDPDGDPATDDAPDVVNASWSIGSPGCDLTFEPDLAALVAGGIVPVVAAGNTGPGPGSGTSPANNPSAFAVGAVDSADSIASFSARGPDTCDGAPGATFPDLVAPGVSIWTTERFGLYGSASGTSLAVPHVAGAVALLRAAFPTADVGRIEAALRSSAVDLGAIGADSTYGAGRLDLPAARANLAGDPPGPGPSPSGGPSASPTTSPAPTATPAPAGPVSGPLAIAPGLTDGRSTVQFATTIDASPGDTVAGAEWFVDVAGPVGTGRPLTASFGAPRVTASGSIPVADLAALAEGAHRLIVHARGGTGAWGASVEGILVLDRTAPVVASAAVTPPSSAGAASVVLSARPSDGVGPISAAEWFRGPDPGAGAGQALAAADGAFDGATETVTGPLSTAGLAYGDHVARLRARDGAGSWSSVVPVPFLVTPADGIFADGFESGAVSAWTAAIGGARLSVESAAALSGDRGLAISLGSKPAYVADGSPSAAAAYRARFRLDLATASTAGRTVDVLAAVTGTGATVISVQVRRGATGSAEVRLLATKRKGTSVSSWIALGSGSHVLEIGWSAGASATASLALDGTVRASLGSLDTSALRIEEVRLGPSAGLGNGATGRLVVDGFVSCRTTWIGG